MLDILLDPGKKGAHQLFTWSHIYRNVMPPNIVTLVHIKPVQVCKAGRITSWHIRMLNDSNNRMINYKQLNTRNSYLEVLIIMEWVTNIPYKIVAYAFFLIILSYNNLWIIHHY